MPWCHFSGRIGILQHWYIIEDGAARAPTRLHISRYYFICWRRGHAAAINGGKEQCEPPDYYGWLSFGMATFRSNEPRPSLLLLGDLSMLLPLCHAVRRRRIYAGCRHIIIAPFDILWWRRPSHSRFIFWASEKYRYSHAPPIPPPPLHQRLYPWCWCSAWWYLFRRRISLTDVGEENSFLEPLLAMLLDDAIMGCDESHFRKEHLLPLHRSLVTPTTHLCAAASHLRWSRADFRMRRCISLIRLL